MYRFFLSRCEIGSDSDRPDGCGVEKFKSERAKNRREFFSTTSRQSLIQTTSKNRMYALNIRGTSNISSPLSIYNSSNITCGNPRVTNLHIHRVRDDFPRVFARKKMKRNCNIRAIGFKKINRCTREWNTVSRDCKSSLQLLFAVCAHTCGKFAGIGQPRKGVVWQRNGDRL